MSTRMKSTTWAAWYHSLGCLPDSDEPEFVGTFEEVADFISRERHNYLRPEVEHDLYVLSIELYDVEFEEE